MSFIRLDNVSIDFKVSWGQKSFGKTVMGALKGFSAQKDTSVSKTFRALDNVSLTFSEGDRVAILGHNGAGKTTLLRVIAGVFEPTHGTVEIDGEVTSLLSITGGSHLKLTGYENIQAQLFTRGFSKSQINEWIQTIAEFSELGDFLHLPLRSYSSGMAMRLCFASTIYGNPSILVMDEWLSTGDLNFIEKAEKRLTEIVNKSKIVIFGTHNFDMVKKVANKAILLHKGRIADIGSPDEIIDRYQHFSEAL